MNYFNNFPNAFYRFGDEASTTLFNNIAVYADIIDQVKDQVTTYRNYIIQPNERPDQLSYKLYNTPNFHWTFFLMNDNIREQGWPITNEEIVKRAKKDYPKTTITTKSVLWDKFKVGQTFIGQQSGATGLIDHINLDLGQLIVTNIVGKFIQNENLFSYDGAATSEQIKLHSIGPQYESAHHYEDVNQEHVDIDPTVGPGANLTPITYLDRYVKQNEDLKEIKVLRPDIILDIAMAFKEAIQS